jgi:uncharacterized repeat protein (TIGR03803 family)
MNSIYRQVKHSGVAAIALTMLAAVTLLAGTADPAQAQTLTPLYDFAGPQWLANPLGQLALGRDGNFYGMTTGGSINEIYQITPDGVETTLWVSPDQYTYGTQCNFGLTLGPDGLLYGPCQDIDQSWSYGSGAIFRFDPSLGQYGFTVIYEFPSYGCSVQPNALTLNTDGNFYGTTQGGNCGSAGLGTFFKITPSGTLTTLHTFQGASGNDAAYPSALTLGSDGNFYGTSQAGGIGAQNLNSGTVFKITPKGKVTLLYVFNGNNNGPRDPAAAPIQGADGKWYGTTFLGGTYNNGTIFQLAGKKLNLLHNFDQSVDNAAFPNFALTLGTDGNFYSPSQDTYSGGYGPESIFKTTTIAKKPVYTDLFNWQLPVGGCTAGLVYGCFPSSPLALHPNGNFYGTTQNGGGGSNDGGVFYSFNTGLEPYIILQFRRGTIGKSIGIFGVGLTGTTEVSFNGTSAEFTVVSDTYLTATVPTGATTGYVTVTTPSATLKSAVKLTVVK